MIKIFVLFLFFVHSKAEQKIFCEFISSPDLYTCLLTLNNPNGFDNFTSIDGQHLSLYDDSKVNVVNTASGNSPNLPKIICEKFKNVKKITLNRYDIQFLTLDALGACENLEALNLHDNSIQLVDSNTFVENLKLREVYFGNNNLITLHSDTLKPLVNLRVLFLNNNQFLTDFTLDAFDMLGQLEEIYLENTGLNRLRKSWFDNLGEVKILHLEGNRIQTLPEAVFSGLHSLETLWLHNNRLHVLEAASFASNFTNLNFFHAHSNRIVFIDRDFVNLVPNLSRFDLSNNYCINERFFNFSNELESNLGYFTKCFENFDDTLRISNPTCRFLLRQDYGYTCELVGVNFDGMSNFKIVAEHPPGFSDENVRAIIFTSSRLSKIPPEIFDKFENLEFLDVKNVNLKTAMIENCNENLKYLDLSENSIRTLYNDALSGCKNLETILMDSNGLNKIQPCLSVMMGNHPNLQQLSLTDNECVDGNFDNLNLNQEVAENGLKKCFAMWHLM